MKGNLLIYTCVASQHRAYSSDAQSQRSAHLMMSFKYFFQFFSVFFLVSGFWFLVSHCGTSPKQSFRTVKRFYHLRIYYMYTGTVENRKRDGQTDGQFFVFYSSCRILGYCRGYRICFFRLALSQVRKTTQLLTLYICSTSM